MTAIELNNILLGSGKMSLSGSKDGKKHLVLDISEYVDDFNDLFEIILVYDLPKEFCNLEIGDEIKITYTVLEEDYLIILENLYIVNNRTTDPFGLCMWYAQGCKLNYEDYQAYMGYTKMEGDNVWFIKFSAFAG